jgi:signal transduction histidine kinase/ligand-binding sensor domain-containing protein
MRYLFVILFSYICSGISFPQNRPVHFERLTSKDGLSQGHVLCMIQDAEGYIWAGTYHGLNRYSGYNFDVFYADQSKPGSLFINVVYSLFEDRDGKIWCGTWGIDVFDKKTETFSHIPALAGDNTISAGEVLAITQDKYGNMWLGTQGGGLNKYNPATEKITYFFADKEKANALKSNFINDLLLDRNQQLWIATEDGGLSMLNIDDESIITFKHDDNNPSSLPSDKISCLCKDKQNNIWIGDEVGNLVRLNRENKHFELYKYSTQAGNHKKAKIMQIAQDAQGNLLLATNGAGFIIYNYQTGNTINYLLHNDNPETIISNENSSILVDRTNTIFIGSYGRGISKYSPFNNKFDVYSIPEDTPENSDINSFTDGIEDYTGHFITGTYNGFIVFNKKDWTYKHYLPGSSYEENKILTLELAPDSTIWLSSMKSLHRYDKNFKKIRSYVFDESLKDHSIYSIEFDKENNLWIALFTKGLLKIPEKEWRNTRKTHLKYTIYLRDENDTNSISGNQQWIILQDRFSNLWIGGVGGLNKYNYEKDNFTRICNPATVKTIDFDSKGTIWMATDGDGLFDFNPVTKDLRRYTVKEGLCHSFTYGIVIDPHEHIWISSESGLSKFDIATGTFRNYDKRDGLPSDHFDDKSESLLSDGRIYMGTNNGFILFRPEDIKDDTSQTRIVLTSLSIDNEDVFFYTVRHQDSITHIPIGQISRIDISRSQRDIMLGFAALHFASPHKIQYKYKLDPYDKNWIPTNANFRRARYTNLDGGEYTFLVEATNSDGKWMTEPLKINIIVHSPIYKTVLFRIIIALLLIIITVLIFRWRIEVEVRQRQILAKLVDERTTEISTKNRLLEKVATDLKDSNTLLKERQQYILEQSEELSAQRDELTLLNATKDKLFSIIAHDLKNPFNVIIGYSELLIARINDWNEEKQLYFLNLLKEASEGAYSLLENLLQWSRSQSGMLHFNPVLKRVNEICGIVLPDIENFARKKGIILINNTEKVTKLLQVDITMMTAILRNLLFNAIKFCEHDQKITIDAEPDDSGYVKFIVRDEGVGMNSEELRNLFVLCKSKSTPGTGGEKGTGIGLLLCKDFVEYHKGKIWVESEPGKGTAFYFTIPMAAE